jgi:hypothetical protein
LHVSRRAANWMPIVGGPGSGPSFAEGVGCSASPPGGSARVCAATWTGLPLMVLVELRTCTRRVDAVSVLPACVANAADEICRRASPLGTPVGDRADTANSPAKQMIFPSRGARLSQERNSNIAVAGLAGAACWPKPLSGCPSARADFVSESEMQRAQAQQRVAGGGIATGYKRSLAGFRAASMASRGPARATAKRRVAVRTRAKLAERVGFEPTVRFHGLRFSRPTRSTTLPPLQRRAGRIEAGAAAGNRAFAARRPRR